MAMRPSRPQKVLVVDDDPLILSTIVTVLRSMGHVVASALNGADALHMLGLRAFDLIITDVHMPEMDGMELLRALRTRYPDVLAIAMTGEGALSSRVALDAARLLGSVGTFEKPIGEADLKRLVHEVLVGERP